MFALRRSDVADLNRRARGALAARGALGDTELVVGEKAFAVGDRVVALRNNRRLGLLNGTLGTVTKIDAGEHALTIATKRGARTVPSSYLVKGHLEHAYAVSIHKAQGMTCDVALLLGDDRLYLEAGYTGLSRGRRENHLYVVAAEPDIESHGAEHDDHDIIRALRRSAAQDTATHIAERSRRSVGVGVEL